MEISRQNANEAIDNFILGNEAYYWSHKYINDEAVPYCDIQNRQICSPVMPAIIDPQIDQIIRGKNEHEAGHARFTPSDKNPSWSPLKGHIMNVLEDLRIEKGLKTLSNVFVGDIDNMNRYFIEKQQTGFQTGKYAGIKPVNEALTALHFQANHFPPEWTLSPEAQAYYDSALPIFNEWENVNYTTKNGFYEVEKIADRIIKVWEQTRNEMNQSGQDQNQNKQNQQNGSGNGSQGNVNSGNIKTLKDDFEDNDNEAQAIKEELERIFEESKKVLNGYKPYTAEDEIKRADKRQNEFEESFSKIRGATSSLQSYLEQSLKTLSRTRTVNNRDKGNLNVHRNATLIAKSLSKDIFSKTVKGISLDTTVSILIDESGSIGYSTSREFQKIVIAFAEVLERLKIKFEVLGHTTDRAKHYPNGSGFTRRTKLVMFEHKNFNETYRSERYRLGSIDYHDCNLDGEALLHTFKRNIQQRSQRHVILVFSDGLPNDCDCSHTILYRNLTDTIKLCRDNGVEVYAFGIGTRDPEKFYGKENFVYLQSVEEMTNAFFRKTADIITNGKRK